MKKIAFNKTITLLVVLVFVTFCFSGCFWFWGAEPIDFEYTLTKEEVDQALAIVDKLEQKIDEGSNFFVTRLVSNMNIKLSYIVHQYSASEILYYSDMQNADSYQKLVFAEDAYMTMREECLRVLKKLYESELQAKDVVFESWTEEDIEMLFSNNEEKIELDRAQNELKREFLALGDGDTKEWSDAVEEIYLDYVNNADDVAEFYGYENYYDYAASEMYMREYSKDQRESFRSIVKESVLPFYLEINKSYKEKRDGLSDAEYNEFINLRDGTCSPDNRYLTGYIDSYSGDMNTVMNYLFDRDALIYTTSNNAYGVAFTNYSTYYEQPYVFLGKGYQDLFTLVHELGHYTSFYHFSIGEVPYDTCEVHSQGNEWMLIKYLDGKIDDDAYEVLALGQLSNGLRTIVLSTIVDEFEEAVYEREIVSTDAFGSIMTSVYSEYEDIEEFASIEDIYNYVQRASMRSPVYYLNYATSEAAAMSLYAIAVEDGYETAQGVYTNLCLETPVDNGFLDTLLDVGLPNPFEESTFINIFNAFDALKIGA